MKEPNESSRRLWLAVARGFVGRCPACGRGAILERYISPAPTCASCGEHLAPYQSADFAPYLVTFLIGLIFTPITIAISLSASGSAILMGGVMSAALASALLLLPRIKGAAIGLLWALDVPNA